MKRLAVVFTGWRDQHDVPDSPKMPRPANNNNKSSSSAAYSSSSSDGSVVQTPEPDDDHPATRWPSWIRSKSSKQKTTHVAAVWDSQHQQHQQSRSARLPPPPPPPSAAPTQLPSEPDSDDDSDHYGDDADATLVRTPAHVPSTLAPPRILQPTSLQPAVVQRAQANVRAITLAALIPPPSPPPLLHLPSTPLFPRSMNPTHTLPRIQNTQIVLLRTTLLRRLEARKLSRAENESIAQFGGRPRRAVPSSKPTTSRQGIDEEAVTYMNKKVRSYSRGLQVWLDRPCFEERCVLWTWDAEGRHVIMRGVIGSGRAIASLEFSEGIEALAGYNGETELDLGFRAPAPQAPPKGPTAPHPQRIASPPPRRDGSSPGLPTPSASTGPSTPTSVPHTVTPRKVLRFVQDPEPEDEEDNVPLGYHIRGRRVREELARQAEERIRQAEEQAREEERMRKVLAEEVKASRARSEVSRSGMMHEAELERVKDRRASYARPAYDPAQLRPGGRRMASEPDTRSPSQSRPASLSRPPSITDVHTKARPPSIRSESLRPPPLPLPRSSTRPSAEELQEEKRRRRASAVSEGGSSVHLRPPSAPPRTPQSAPPLPGMHMNMGMMAAPVPVPQMPMMPMYPAMPGQPQFFYVHPQMPLLPPMRPGLPVSRSVESMPTTRAHHAHVPRQESPRRSIIGGDAKRSTPARHSGHVSSSSRGLKPALVRQ